MLENFTDFIDCGALGRYTSYRSDQGTEFAGRDLLTEIRPSRLRDALLHQSAAEIVRSCLQAGQGCFKSKLDPRDLDVGDVAVQKHACECMDDQIFVDRVSCAGASGLEKSGLRMNESQRNKFRKLARFFLNLAEQKQMSYPMFRTLGVAVHHCGCRGYAETVRRANHLDPLSHFQFIGT